MNKNNAQALKEQSNWQSIGLPDLKTLKQRYASALPEILKEGGSELGALNVLRTALGVSIGGSIEVNTPIEQVNIKDDMLLHVVEKRDAKRERYANLIMETLMNPLEVWRTKYDDGSSRNRYIKLFSGNKDVYVVVKIDDVGGMLWNFVPTRIGTVQKMREGELIFSGY